MKARWGTEETRSKRVSKKHATQIQNTDILGGQLLENWTGCLVQEVRKDVTPKTWGQTIFGLSPRLIKLSGLSYR